MRKEKENISLRFPTLSALVEHVRRLPGPEGSDHPQGDGSYWAGGTEPGTCARAIHLATYGWPEGAAKASQLAESVVNHLVAKTGVAPVVELTMDVTGAVYDVGSYLAGEPECWVAPQVVQQKRAVRLVNNSLLSGGIPSESITNRGIAVAALALALNTMGYPVTIDTWMHGEKFSGGSYRILTRITDASTGSPLDVDRVVYALAHPMSVRKLQRAAVDDTQNNDSTSFWGSARPMSDSRPEDGEPIDVYIGGMHYNEFNRWHKAEEWVMRTYLEQVKKGGVNA